VFIRTAVESCVGLHDRAAIAMTFQGIHGIDPISNRFRLHLALDKLSSYSRSIQSVGRIIVAPDVSGLNNRSERGAQAFSIAEIL
jgi:hypothetical protein